MVFNRYLLTTIHSTNFLRNSSMYVTIHERNFRQIYNISTSTPGSWHALRPGGQRVRAVIFDVLPDLKVIYHPLYSINNFVTRSKLPQDEAQVFPYMG